VPFEGEYSKAVMVKHCKQALTPPDRHNLDLSFGFVKCIQKMMSKRRENRHASTAELLDDLQSIDFLLEVEHEPAEAPMPALGKGVQEEIQRKPIPRPQQMPVSALPRATEKPAYLPWLIGALLASLALNVVLLIVLVMR
jgi:hypothetical protein